MKIIIVGRIRKLYKVSEMFEMVKVFNVKLDDLNFIIGIYIDYIDFDIYCFYYK